MVRSYGKFSGVLLFILFLFTTLSSCGEREEKFRFSGMTMGTTWSVIVSSSDSYSADSREGKALEYMIGDELSRVNKLFSSFDRESEVSRINAAPGGQWVSVSEETLELISAALKISKESGWAFDITVGTLVDLYGFGSKKVSGLPSEKEIGRAMRFIGKGAVQVRRQPPALKKKYSAVKINLSAIAKGYAVDRVAKLLENKGLRSYMVEVGGEVRVGKRPRGRGKWKIGIPLPETLSSKLLRVLEIENVSVATSGEYNNFRVVNGKRVSHTIDPATGHSVQHSLASVTVLAPSCQEADGCATAINVMGVERGLDFARKMKLALLLVVSQGQGYKIITNDRFDAMFKSLNKK